MNIRIIGLIIAVSALVALMIWFGPEVMSLISVIIEGFVTIWKKVDSFLFIGLVLLLIVLVIKKTIGIKLALTKVTNLAQENSSKKDLRSDHRYDSSVIRNKGGRWIVFILSAILSVVLPTIFLSTVSTQLPFSDMTLFPAAVVGMIIGVVFFSKILPRFIVDVPQVQGFITINKLISLLSAFSIKGATDVIYGPGWHISYPWEGRSEKSNFSLEVFTLDWSEEVPGQTTQLLVTGSYQFEVDLPRSDRFIGIDEETINKGALDIIKAYASDMLSDKSGDDAKSHIKDYNDDMMREFGLKKNEPEERKASKVTDFEERYGIKSVAITISGIDLPSKVQETRDAVDEAQQVISGVAAMYGMEVDVLKSKLQNGIIPSAEYNEMLDRFAAKSDNAEMKINAIKVHGLDALAPLVKQLAGDKQ